MEVLQMQYVAMPYCNALLQCLAINQATNSVFECFGFYGFPLSTCFETDLWFGRVEGNRKMIISSMR